MLPELSCTVKSNCQQLDIGLASAWRKAAIREAAHCGHSNAPAEYAMKEEKEALEAFRNHSDDQTGPMLGN